MFVAFFLVFFSLYILAQTTKDDDVHVCTIFIGYIDGLSFISSFYLFVMELFGFSRIL